MGREASLSSLLEASHGNGDSDRHLLVLYALATASRARVLLELGVKDGATTLPLLMAARENSGVLFSVDKASTSFDPGELADSWSFKQEDSLDFLAQWPKEQKIDFVFIDDWHSYEHVAREFQLLDPLIGPGSLVLLHDTMWSHTEPFYHVDFSMNGQWANGGPARAMMELDDRWEWATLPWGHGLSIIRKKHSKIYHTR